MRNALLESRHGTARRSSVIVSTRLTAPRVAGASRQIIQEAARAIPPSGGIVSAEVGSKSLEPEAYASTIIEDAKLLGKPIVASDIAVHREQLDGERGILLPIDDQNIGRCYSRRGRSWRRRAVVPARNFVHCTHRQPDARAAPLPRSCARQPASRSLDQARCGGSGTARSTESRNMIIWALLGGASLLLLAALAYYTIRTKRWLWSEIGNVRRQLEEMQHQVIAARKQILLNAVGGELRLPAMMPSQNGEDVLIHKFFGGRRTGRYVEVGAYDGVGFSNTYFLDALGWDGILVEPAPHQAEACRRSRPHSRVVHAACGQGDGRIRFKVVKVSVGIGTLSYMGDNPKHEQRIAREGGTI